MPLGVALAARREDDGVSPASASGKQAGSQGTSGRRAGLLVVVALLVLGAAGLWFATSGVLHQAGRRAAADLPLPAFRLPVLDAGLLEGDTTFLSSSELTGHVVLLEYWAPSCTACVAEQPLLMELQEDYGAAGLRVVGVLDSDSTKATLAWLRAHRLGDFLTVVGDEKVVQAGHVGTLPTTLLVGRNGHVVERFQGYSSERDPYVRERVRELIVKR